MAHVAEANRLGAIQLGQSLGSLPRVFLRLRIAISCANLDRNEVDEPPVVVVEYSVRVQACDENAVSTGLTRRLDWQNDRLMRWSIPPANWQVAELWR